MASHTFRVESRSARSWSYVYPPRAMMNRSCATHAAAADSFLRKMRSDVPVLQALPTGSLNLYGVPSLPDRLDLIVEVAGQTIEVTGG